MSKDSSTSIRVTQAFDAPPERIFDAWLDPVLASRWMFASVSGQNVRSEIDARIGGKFTIVDRREGEDVAHTGEYLEIDRPRRLTFQFAVRQYSDKVTRVSVNIAPKAGGCELTLEHGGIPREQSATTKKGWATMLLGLEKVCAPAAVG